MAELDERMKGLKVKCTTIPLSEKELDECFDHMEDYYFLLAYEFSEFQGRKFLNYIYNSNMKCDLQKLSYDVNDKYTEKLLWEYLKYDRECHIPLLEDLWCKILYLAINSDAKPKDMREEERRYCKYFIAKYLERIREVLSVFRSLKAYLLNSLAQTLDKDEKMENVEDREYPEYIGKNWITIRYSKYFWELSSQMPIDTGDIYNYKEFFKYYYGGYRIVARFLEEFSPYSVLATVLKEQRDKKKGKSEDVHNQAG